MTDIIAPEEIPPAIAPPPPSHLPNTGIANLPNQRHKIVAKNGANFTIMVCGKSKTGCIRSKNLKPFILIGESGVGKTTFVNTLFTTTIKDPKNLAKRQMKPPAKTVQIQITKAGRVK